MSEEDKNPINKLFEGHGSREREDKVLRYMAHRLEKGESLQDVKQEEYVQRNVTSTELDLHMPGPEAHTCLARGHGGRIRRKPGSNQLGSGNRAPNISQIVVKALHNPV